MTGCTCINESYDKIRRIRTLCPSCINSKNKVKAKRLTNRNKGQDSKDSCFIKFESKQSTSMIKAEEVHGIKGQRWELSLIHFNPNANQNGTKILKVTKKEKKVTIMKDFFYDHPLRELFQSFTSYPAERNFMTILGFPNIDSINESAIIWKNTICKMQKGLKAKRKNVLVKIISMNETVLAQDIIGSAINIFFDKGCEVFQLFNKKDFDFYSKTKPLQWAILLYGLSYMPEDVHVTKLFENISKKLEYAFRSPNLIPFYLESLQALLILIGYMFIPWVLRSRGWMVQHCQRISIAMGLHKQYFGKNKSLDFERRQAYIFMNFTFSIFDLLCDTHMATPHKVYVLDESKFITAKYSQNLIQAPFKVDLEHEVSKIFHNFLQGLSAIIFQIRIFKEKITQKTNISVDLTSLFDLMQKKLQELTIKSTNKLSTISFPSNVLFNLNSKVNNIHNFMMFIYHFVKAFVFSINFYNQDGFSYYSRKSADTLIDELLFNCRRTVYHAKLLPKGSLMLHVIGPLAVVLVFMLRANVNKKCSLSHLDFKAGYDFINSLTSYPPISLLARVNKSTLDLFMETMNYKM